MIEEVIALASYSYFEGGTIGNLLNEWQQAGFFSYLLPFLLIFAVIFGILSQSEFFKKNKAVNAIIALVVGLLALQFDFVPRFFAEIFPRLGVGLAVLLIAIILLGMFIDKKQFWVFMILGGIIFLVIMVNTGMDLGWSGASDWAYHWPKVLAGVLIVGAIIAIIVGSGKGGKKKITIDPSE